MKPLTKEQADEVAAWLATFRQLEIMEIPVKFRERFAPKKNRITVQLQKAKKQSDEA